MHNHKSTSNNKSSGAILFKHRTKPKNSSGRFVILSIIPLLPLFLLSILLNLSAPLGGDAYATTTTLTVDNSDTVLELTLPSSLTLDLTPSSTNNYISFNTTSLGIGIGTNNPAGYTLSMTALSSSLTRTSSITDGSNTTTTPTISPLSTTASPTGYNATDYESSTYNTYTLNTWGYKLSTATNYLPMTTNTIELASTSQASNATFITNSSNTTIGQDLILDFAAKVDSSIPAGSYATTLSFALVANVASNLNCDVDLTGCTFYFNDTVYAESGGWFAHVNFTSAGSDYNYIYTIRWQERFFGENRMEYYYDSGSISVCQGELGADYVSDWADQSYRTITITGGEDVTNSEIIDWLYANATLVSS